MHQVDVEVTIPFVIAGIKEADAFEGCAATYFILRINLLRQRIFVIVDEVEKGVFEDYIIINPKIISHSEELIYVGEGEGCLSINRCVEGIVPRYARITVEAQDMEGNKFQIRVREDIAIAFQHEMDHLDGILFVDKIDPKDPFKNQDKMREI